jgi:DNA processing protein
MIPVAIVGSRNATAYGRYTTDRLSRELALRGITIVSGMARGIDSSAHRGALAARGSTIAVLGSGLDVIYPLENKKLFDAISQNGAVISEYPPGTQPIPYHFPARNRIISGISYGVVVVEAGEKSGSLITASLAIEQGRDVFAIPGTIDSAHSRGTNSLIKHGAKLIDTIDDILEDVLPQLGRPSVQPMQRQQEVFSNAFLEKDMGNNHDPLPPPFEEILKTLSEKKIHVDDIITATSLPSANVLSILIILELKGIIEQHPGKYFSLKK